MKSNGGPDRYVVYIKETWVRAVEVVATSSEMAQDKAYTNYISGLYSRNHMTKESFEDKSKWHVSRIEGCC